jgi:hypothetical protein
VEFTPTTARSARVACSFAPCNLLTDIVTIRSIEIFPLNYSKPGGCPNITHQLVYITDITSPTIQFYQGQTVINGSSVPVCFYFGGTDLRCGLFLPRLSTDPLLSAVLSFASTAPATVQA